MKKILEEADKDHIWYNGSQFISLRRVGEMINKRKSDSDIVEVIKCHKCKYFKTDIFRCDIGLEDVYSGIIVGHNGCSFWAGTMVQVEPNGYCKWGERRDDDEREH